MGTRADYYLGRDGTWLGSIAWDGYPAGQPADLLAATTEAEYQEALAGLLERKDASIPAVHGWPWPWEDSALTDYAYAYEDGAVWVCRFDGPWHPAGEELPDEEPKGSHAWPLHGGVAQEVTLGPRSGLIVATVKRED